jgi:hypothetical protein
MISPATLPATPAKPEPTNACLRCGRPIPIGDSLCELCNPLGLKQPAATQVHAIAAGGVVFFVVVLALLAQVGLSGVGPFSGRIMGVEARDDGLAVSISVTNGGTKGAATTCRVIDAERIAGGPGQVIQTPVIPAGDSLTFTATVSAFGPAVRTLAVDCQSP